MNIAWWDVEHVRSFPDEQGLVVDGQSWTNFALHDQAARLARALVALGVAPGDRVAVALPNSREVFVACSAVMIAGGVLVVLSDASDHEVTRVLEHCEPRALICGSRLASSSLVAPVVEHRICVGGQMPPGCVGFEELLAEHDAWEEPVPRSEDDAAQLCYTSGTTGRPKGVVYTHGGINAFRRSRVAEMADRSARTVVVVALPPTAFAAAMVKARVIRNTKYVVLNGFDARAVLRAIEEHQATELPLVPTMAEQLVACRPSPDYDCSSLELISIGGAHVSDLLVAKLRERFAGSGAGAAVTEGGGDVHPHGRSNGTNHLKIAVIYGMTETGGGIASGDGGPDGLIGRTLSDVEVRIVDSEGRPLPKGRIGEIAVRTARAAGGYWRDPEATAAVFRDGVVYTGDLGYVTDQDDLAVVGRTKDVIIQGGLNVFPEEVAGVIRGIPGVERCAVVGVPNELLGEEIVACVVPTSGSGVTARQIRSICKARLEPRKRPCRVVFVETLPTTLTGKLDTQALRESVTADVETAGDHAFLAQLAAAEPNAREKLIRTAVEKVVAEVLEDDPSSPNLRLAPEMTFGDAGLDSIGVARLTHSLSSRFGMKLSPTLAYAHPTLGALCKWIEAATLERDQIAAQPLEPPRETAAEPLAIVGIGCRLPCGVNDAEALWSLLQRGVDATTEAPEWRCAERRQSWRAAFVEDIDQFDAHFFRLAAEASELDPRHRMVLEVAWEALEDAGHDPFALPSSRVGVFLGMYGERYRTPNYLGAAPGMAVSRLCHFLNLRGPAVTVDTTCSSSLVALHHAVASLRSGECDIAIVGGANLLAEPRAGISLGVVSPRGRSRPFDGAADGFGQGEGCVLVVLKRLSEAVTEGCRIYALVRGTAINHDGRSSSLTAPNPGAQEEVIRRALAAAATDPDAVQYVEAHGTGTLVGDPIEVEGLTRVFQGRIGPPLRIGSVKGNIGHMEAAAGIVGVVKAALAIRHRRLPPSLHVVNPNPNIPWGRIPIRLQSELGDWPSPGAPLIAGVSSFGMSGTNAHAILSEPPLTVPGAHATADEPTGKGRSLLLPLSARSAAALHDRAERCAIALDGPDEGYTCRDIAYTASCRRAHHEFRLAVVGRSRTEWAEKLRRYRNGDEEIAAGHAPEARRDLVMVFSGQGAHWLGMARQLLDEEPRFEAAIDQCARYIERHVAWRLRDELSCSSASSSRMSRTDVSQPVLFAMQVGIFELWRSWGVTPVAVLGHSLGEVTAAYAAGALSLEQAAWLVCERGRIAQKAAGNGRMAAVEMSLTDAEAFVRDVPDLEIAASNGPTATTLTGETEAVLAAVERLRRRGVRVKLLAVDCAFHSRQMDGCAEELGRVLEGTLFPGRPTIPLISTLTVQTNPSMDGTYWSRQLRGRVQFREAVESVLLTEPSILLEIGPQAVLSPALRTILDAHGRGGSAPAVIASLRRNVSSRDAMLDALARLYCAGFPVDWSRLHSPPGRLAPLPSYPWEHESYWYEAPAANAPRPGVGRAVGPPRRAERALRSATAGGRGMGTRSSNDDACLQRVQWAPAAAGALGGLAERCLLFADRTGVGDGLRDALQARGVEVTLVGSGAGEAPGRASDADDCAAARVRSAVADAASAARPTAIVYLWTLDVLQEEDAPVDRYGDACEDAVRSVLSVLQAVAKAQWQVPPRVFIVTQGTQVAVSRASGVAQAPAWGAGLSFAREYPVFDTKLIDLDPNEVDIGRLCDELATGGGDDQVVLRGGERLTPRLVPVDPEQARDIGAVVRKDASYLVTGGLGALGLVAARWLVENGARHLVLAGRRPPGERAREALAELRAAGAQVRTESVDVADADAVRRMLGETMRGMPALRGVFHCAGVIDDRTVGNLDEPALRAVLAPKVRGSWSLHRLTGELDFLVLFSSLASVLGNPGQANYAAANAFLDALCRYRAGRSLAAQSINWGGWSIGMAPRQRVAADASGLIDETLGMAMLGRIVRSRAPQVVATRSSVPLGVASRSPADARESAGLPAAGAGRLAERLARAAERDRVGMLNEHLRGEVAMLAQLPLESLEESSKLDALGIDSLGVIRLLNRVSEQTGIHVPPAALSPDATFGQLVQVTAEASGALSATPARSQSSLVWLRSEGHRPTLAFIHPIGGGTSCYTALVKGLPHQAVAIEAPGLRAGRSPASKTIGAMADDYLAMLNRAAVSHPYVLLGWSLGGVIAFEMARRLGERGLEPLVVLIDSYCPVHHRASRGAAGLDGWDDVTDGNLPLELAVARRFLIDISAGERVTPEVLREVDEALTGLNGEDAIAIVQRVERESRRFPRLRDLSVVDLERMYSIYRLNLEAIREYRPATYNGPVLSIRAVPTSLDPDDDWRCWAPHLEVAAVQGSHRSILYRPTVDSVIDALRRRLARATDKRASLA